MPQSGMSLKAAIIFSWRIGSFRSAVFLVFWADLKEPVRRILCLGSNFQDYCYFNRMRFPCSLRSLKYTIKITILEGKGTQASLTISPGRFPLLLDWANRKRHVSIVMFIAIFSRRRFPFPLLRREKEDCDNNDRNGAVIVFAPSLRSLRLALSTQWLSAPLKEHLFYQQHVIVALGFLLLGSSILLGPLITSLITRTPQSHAVSTSKRGVPLTDSNVWSVLSVGN